MNDSSRERRRRQYLEVMGVTVWVQRDAEPAGSFSVPSTDSPLPTEPVPHAPLAPPPAVAVNAPAGFPDWESLESAVRGCQRCGLCETRTQTVFGVGNRQTKWMFVGEAPGADEDAQGEPFVGRAGQLLNAMLFATGLKREEVYIANVLKCLRYNALVQLSDGSWERIGRLVRGRYSGDVMTVNDCGHLVPRRVTGWYETPIGGRRVFRLTYRNAKNAGKNRTCIQLTGDHEVLTQRGYVAVEDLRAGDEIATGQGLSELAFDVVCGTLLGDGYLAASRTLLSFGHSARQRDYALFKAELLSELNPTVTELSVAAVSGGEKAYAIVQVRTQAHRALRILRPDFYAPTKRVPPWISEKMNARMLAFWFMDDGHTRIRDGRQPIAEIATCGFVSEDLSVLLEGLSRLGLGAKVRRGRIQFDVRMTRKISECIAPYVPSAMRYKLHPEVAKSVPFDGSRLRRGFPVVSYDEFEIQDITDQPRSDTTFFCIDVEETHNFVTAGGVVHNCRPPGNRDPQPAEVEQCEPYLIRQIELIKPALIVALGRHAAHSLLKTEQPLSRLRGQKLNYHGTPLVVTYHPAYLLRNLPDKRKAWEDLCLARRLVEGA